MCLSFSSQQPKSKFMRSKRRGRQMADFEQLLEDYLSIFTLRFDKASEA